MPIVPFTPPVSVTPAGGFDYVTVDAVNRRVYAAHGGASTLLVVDADTGKVIGQVKVGAMAGLAIDPASGHVFTGDGDDKALSEVDPVSLTEVHRVAVDGLVDAIAYDPTLSRIYGDEDNGTRIFVIDAKTFKQIGTIALPGHKPEYLQINPATHEIYQNIATLSEVVVIDPKTMSVSRTIPTPEITNNHPLQYDPVFDQLLVGGSNGKLSVYTSAGKLLHTIDVPNRMDQCDLDRNSHLLACAGSGKITLIKNDGTNAPTIVGQIDVDPGMHTLAIDPKTGYIWAVWGSRSGGGAFVQGFVYRP
jgi:outer membrane protein assembly factor BamB